MKMLPIGEYIKFFVIAVIIVFVAFAFGYIDFQWTKNSLEELSGRQVSNSTVIWTMMNTRGRRK